MTRRVILDWASYQGVPDAGAIRAAHPEVAGGIVKATEGMWKWTNPSFDAQVASLRNAGLPVGFYNLVHPGFAGTADARLFLERIAGQNPELCNWQDCEVSDGVPAAEMLPRLLEDANYISARYPMKTGFYSAPWWWNPNTIGSVAAHMERWPFWVANYSQVTLPPLPVPWTHSLFWQFTDNYGGMHMDASLFMGDDKMWDWMVGGHSPGPLPPPPVPSRTLRLQQAVHASRDGIFGPDTDRRCMGIRALTYGGVRFSQAVVRYAQQVMAFSAAQCDGIWGPITASHWVDTVKAIQAALGVAVDGDWGKLTDQAFYALDPLR